MLALTSHLLIFVAFDLRDSPLNGIETTDLEQSFRVGRPTPSEGEHLLKVPALFLTLGQLLHKKRPGILTLLRRIFGISPSQMLAAATSARAS